MIADHRATLVVVSGLCVRLDGTVLMGLRRGDRDRPHLWELPGGKVGAGESHDAALRREWREELGVEVDVLPELLAADRINVEVTIVVYLYRVVLRTGAEPRCLDHAEVGWFRPAEAVRHLPCSPGYYLQYRMIEEVAAVGASSTAGTAPAVEATPAIRPPVALAPYPSFVPRVGEIFEALIDPTGEGRRGYARERWHRLRRLASDPATPERWRCESLDGLGATGCPALGVIVDARPCRPGTVP